MRARPPEEKLSLYEKLCGMAEKLPFPMPWKSLDKKYKEAIEFSHLHITSKGAFSLAVLAFMLILFIPSALLFSVRQFSISTLIFILALATPAFYFLYGYPMHYATLFRIRASSEMILCIVYMSISMRITYSLETAVEFVAKNLKGPLGYDLRQLMWNVYTGRYHSMDEGLDRFISKWKRENEEFVKAISLIRASSLESMQTAEKTLDEAVRVMLEETKERMKRYSRELVAPVTVINSMGIVLPLVGIVFLPIIGLFLPEMVQPVFLAAGYDIFLPLAVYWMMKDSLEKRPYTFHQPDISRHPGFREERLLSKNLAASIAVSAALISFSLFHIALAKENFSFSLFLYSILATVGIAAGIIIYSFFSVREKLGLRAEIVQMESEFGGALVEVKNQLARGIPMEGALKKILPKIRELRISGFFRIALHNIESFGMTFERAIFDEVRGAIRQYPSTLIEAMMRAIVEISKRGREVTARAMETISSHLRDVGEVEDTLRAILGETVSSMQIQAYLLAPLTAGIVVALTAGVMKLMVSFAEAVGKIQGTLAGGGLPEHMGLTVFSSLLDVNHMLPIHYFQLIVGVYLVEVVAMLAIFISTISYGEENLLKRRNIAAMLLVAVVMYVILAIGIYLVFDSLMPRLTALVAP